ncbi:FadR/GntR family transcriptional regulator [Trueperella pyogenes]|uniref:FadR/GntR family transcriptional regulator n=1 Tax=Trueperella pyogenes TaxID=1661 RepID=UPI00324ACC57
MPGTMKVDEAIEGIIQRIIDGTFTVDRPLPPEAELAALLDISRPTLRECVRSLSDGGVLRVIHGRGTFLAPRQDWHHLPTLITVLSSTTDQLELGIQLTQVRRMIEVGAAGLAAQHRTDADIERMESVLDGYDAAKDAEEAVALDISYHELILHASGNPFLSAIMQPLSEALLTSRRFTTSSADVRRRAQKHHRRIFDCIRAGDAQGAKDAMRAHMSQTHDDIVRLGTQHRSLL